MSTLSVDFRLGEILLGDLARLSGERDRLLEPDRRGGEALEEGRRGDGLLGEAFLAGDLRDGDLRDGDL